KEVPLFQRHLCIHQCLLDLKEGTVLQTSEFALSGLLVGGRFLHTSVILVLEGQGDRDRERKPKAVALAKVCETARGHFEIWIVRLMGQGEGQIFSLHYADLGNQVWSMSERLLCQVLQSVRNDRRRRVTGNAKRSLRGTAQHSIELRSCLAQIKGLGRHPVDQTGQLHLRP